MLAPDDVDELFGEEPRDNDSHDFREDAQNESPDDELDRFWQQ